ncbi:MAG: aminotransferase class V-fold PLP-dependent enzyme [Gemmataceae bacterium]
MIYLDNAATSWPKPSTVSEAMKQFLETSAGNPGRSGHRLSLAAGRVLYDLREALAEFFGLEDPLRLVFTSGVTESVNIVLHGMLKPGDHVVTSSIEHNSIMRPLRSLEEKGIRLTVVPCGADGSLDPHDIESSLCSETRLVVLTHASNVCGTILPVAEVGAITRRNGILLLVDAAQTAGMLPVDMTSMNIDLLAFSGHKGLLGPTGTGGLAIGERVDVSEIRSQRQGGTGSRSEDESQPEFLPDKFESGTPNSVGLAGLMASLEYLQHSENGYLRQHDKRLTSQMLEGLRTIKGLRLFGPGDPEQQIGVVSFTLDGFHVSDVAAQLDEEHEILCRPGLHCSPAAHRTLGTSPAGTVRLSPGPFTTSRDIDKTLNALANLARTQK